MVRRTLALAGALAFAAGFTGLAGPANADPGIAALPDIGIHEVAAELDDASITGDVDGTFIQLRNNATSGTISLDGHVLSACNPSGTLEPLVVFEPDDEIAAESNYLIGGPDYNAPFGPIPNKFFDAGADSLLQSAGGVELVNGSVVDNVAWGMVTNTDCANFVPAGSTPTDKQSLNRTGETAWTLQAATPAS